jgi:hypothetical protein
MSLTLTTAEPLTVPEVDCDPTVEYLYDLYWRSGDEQAQLVRSWKWDNFPHFQRHVARLSRVLGYGVNVPVGLLHLAKIDGRTGDVIDFGLASAAVVTDVGCQKIVAAMNTSDATTAVAFKFHGLGTGTTAEAAGDTALVTELTTEYNPNSTRATGTQTTGSTTKVYRTVATNTLDSGTPAVTEHGVFSASSAGSLLDRSVFSAINLVGANGDGIQSTYDLTFTSGG